MNKLDLKDRRLLFELDINARQPVSVLARKLRLSRDIINYRIQRLEKNNIIRGYRTIIDTSKLGYTFYRILIRVFNSSPKDEQNLIDFLKREPNVWWIASLDGLYDFNFAIWAKDEKEMLDFQRRIFYHFKNIIKNILICPIIKYTQLSRNYLVHGILKQPIERQMIILEKSAIVEYDKIDTDILKIISEDARISLVRISQKVNLDPVGVKYRIKRLEKKGIIKGYKVDLDFGKLKRDFYSVKINLNSLDELKKIMEYIRIIPEANGIIEALGSYDIEFDLEVEGSKRYYEIINDIKSRFNSIRSIYYFRVKKNFKVLYMPEM